MVLFIPGSESLSVISGPAGRADRDAAAADMEHALETVPPAAWSKRGPVRKASSNAEQMVGRLRARRSRSR